jgi:hypothetical protein
MTLTIDCIKFDSQSTNREMRLSLTKARLADGFVGTRSCLNRNQFETAVVENSIVSRLTFRWYNSWHHDEVITVVENSGFANQLQLIFASVRMEGAIAQGFFPEMEGNWIKNA